jgi:hypothetical protein
VWLVEGAAVTTLRQRLARSFEVAVDGELTDPPILLVRASPAQIHAMLSCNEIAAISLYQVEPEG